MSLGLYLLIIVRSCTLGTAGEIALLSEPIPSEQGFAGAVRVVDFALVDRIAYATVNIEYRDIRGQARMGQGRIFVRMEDLQSRRILPAFCRVHYEMDVDNAQKWCRRGFAVATAHYGNTDSNGYPLELCTGDSYNLSKALIQWVRRLQFVDRTHLHLDGESAGGYVALAISAECFPVTSVAVNMPVLNWPYNLNYLERNKALAKAPVKDMRESPLPVMGAVSMLTDWSYGVFGNDLCSEKWYYLSPISFRDRITCPVLLVCATGDMLVPIEQVSRRYAPTLNAAEFPEGYTRDFDALTLVQNARLTLEQALLADKIAFHSEPRREVNYEITLERFMKSDPEPPAPPEKDLWWSKNHQWSVVVLDEGSPAPYSAHTRYKWSVTPETFVAHFRDSKPGPELLNEAKLDYLLRRYMDAFDKVPTLADGTPVSRRNFDVLEKLDVVTGLLDYADLGSRYQARLCMLYAKSERKPFGSPLVIQSLERERHSLLELLGRSSKP